MQDLHQLISLSKEEIDIIYAFTKRSHEAIRIAQYLEKFGAEDFLYNCKMCYDYSAKTGYKDFYCNIKRENLNLENRNLELSSYDLIVRKDQFTLIMLLLTAIDSNLSSIRSDNYKKASKVRSLINNIWMGSKNYSFGGAPSNYDVKREWKISLK